MTPSTPKPLVMGEEMGSSNASLSPDAKGRADTEAEPAAALSMGRKLHDAWQAVVPPSGWGEPIKWGDFDADQQTIWDKAAVRFACLIGPAAPAWQPIESAPKDGTRIMVWDSDGVTTAHWCACQENWTEIPHNNDERSDFTHWQPLPETPQ